MGVSIGYSKGILSDEQVSMIKNQLEEMIQAIPQVIAKTIDFFEKNSSIFRLAKRFIALVMDQTGEQQKKLKRNSQKPFEYLHKDLN